MGNVLNLHLGVSKNLASLSTFAHIRKLANSQNYSRFRFPVISFQILIESMIIAAVIARPTTNLTGGNGV